MEQIKVGLYGRTSLSADADRLKMLMQILRRGASVCVYAPFAENLGLNGGGEFEFERFASAQELERVPDCLLSIGGDGTFLEASRFAVELDIPILGINFGRLGFLAQVAAEEMEPALEQLFRKDYTVEKRTLISVYDGEGSLIDPYALNEVTVQRSNPTMLRTVLHVDGELLSAYWSDGILISTPTGSTAYSLSLGGPVVTPDNRSFVVSPIAPHNLNLRPIVISDESEIVVETETRKGTAVLSIDNRMMELASGTRFTVKKSQNMLNFLKLKNYNFFKALRTKLNWGTDLRS
ncbi:MAG: NAD(+)/NADH kinase [Prevotellaceae bacterium]|jgi:NAD+ kinase|nr:NAD(+)/NADH kinase [Prevotellaceae bacterium]